MSDDDRLEKHAQSIIERIDLALLAIVKDPRAVFAERSAILGELRGLLAEQYHYGRRAGMNEAVKLLKEKLP